MYKRQDLYKQNISYDKIEEKSISAEKILKVIETKILNNKIKSIVVGIPGFIHDGIIGMADGIEAVSYTHLDVYKRQAAGRADRL